MTADLTATTPAGYESWSAAEKHRWMWEELFCAGEYSPVERPDLTLAKPWTMASVGAKPDVLSRTLDRTDDLMEADRPKIIHAQGVAAMVELRIAGDSPFTGVLGGGPTPVGVARFSLATPPSGKKSFTPGLGLKVFVDGAPSLDLLAMNHTVGQGRDHNVFANTFSHDLRGEHSALRPPQKLLAFFFRMVSTQPRRLTIDHLATTRPDGSTEAAPAVPDRLVFHPHRAVKAVYRTTAKEDFRVPFLSLEPELDLYEIEAIGPHEERRVIGTITATSTFVCAPGVDRLFFRHHVAEADRLRRWDLRRINNVFRPEAESERD